MSLIIQQCPSDFSATTPPLSQAELARLEKIKLKQHRRLMAFAHTLKREQLAPALDISPELIEFETLEHGKPVVSLHQNPNNIEFNLSHAGEYVMVGISDNGPIGVDIEKIKGKDWQPIAKRFFHPLEVEQLEQADDANQLFFQLWTLKEAFVKAIGHGLSYGLEKFAIDGRTGQLHIVEEQYQHATCSLVDAPAQYTAAVCYLNK